MSNTHLILGAGTIMQTLVSVDTIAPEYVVADYNMDVMLVAEGPEVSMVEFYGERYLVPNGCAIDVQLILAQGRMEDHL